METTKKKPKAYFSNSDGNVFSLLAVCTRALKNADQSLEASELTEKVFASGSYDEAIQSMMEYCDVV